MGGPAYHGWTHRPMSEGGTDPIPAVSSDLKWAKANGAASATALPDALGVYKSPLTNLYSNDATAFELADVTAGKADWLQINTAGYYVAMLQAVSNNAGVWDAVVDTRIQPIYDQGGTIQSLQESGMGVADYLGDWFGPRAQYKAGGKGDLMLATTLTFNWNPDDPVSDLDFENPLKISTWVVASSASESVRLGIGIFVMRIADAGYTDISPA